MNILYATTNKGKIEEIKRTIKLENIDVNIITLTDINFNEEIIEKGKTFEENSEIKADAVKSFCDKNNINYELIVADDGGMCIDFLGGKPGVYSARYAGKGASQEKILYKVLYEMKEAQKEEQRKATFVCVLTGILKNGKKIVKVGKTHGKIAFEISKLGGLTYNPIFIPNGFNKTIIEMNDEEFQNVHNHRMSAFEALLKEINLC